MAAVALQLAQTAAKGHWRGPDAYDGLWWSWPAPLVGGQRRRQAFMQLHARSPWDVRKPYRRRHPLIPKARRFEARRLEGLRDATRSGRPLTHGPDVRALC